jgi:hypothetical protein
VSTDTHAGGTALGIPFDPFKMGSGSAPVQSLNVPAETTLIPEGNVDVVLEQRGQRYGNFMGQAIIVQGLKAVMRDAPNWEGLDDDMKEALEMVALKIGRILNGDPTYRDSWTDILGYVRLVEKKL